MFMYVLIGLCLVLLGVTGLQFTYLFYIDRMYKERRKYLQTLEYRCAQLQRDLERAEERIIEQNEMLQQLNWAAVNDEEAWADIIDER
jgi:hypothetical protein